jgi:hypothetical protein
LSDDPLAVEVSHIPLPQAPFQHGQGRCLGAERRLADLGRVGDVQIDQVAEGAELGGPR